MSGTVEAASLNYRFQCQRGCTNCCTRSGDVYLTEQDIERIAGYLGFERQAFERRYVERSGGRPRLTEPRADSCHFLQAGGCAIHQVKPLQCRTFPFWPENIENRRSWNALRSFCPGVGAGPLVNIEEIRSAAQAYRDAFPGL